MQSQRVKVVAGGKLVIPAAFRREMGITPGDTVILELDEGDAVDAHHDRYDEPLNVRWLCRRHHVRLHCYGEDMFPIGRPLSKTRSPED